MSLILNIFNKIDPEDGRITNVTTSIPRDCLQSERSLLQYCKFSGMLCFASLAILLDFKFSSTSEKGSKIISSSFSPTTFSKALGIILFFLSVGSLVLGGFNYYVSTKNYIQNHTKISPKSTTKYFLMILVLTLLSLDITLLIESNK
ncbi:hypothetical protein WICMUC_003451 [Wickerhamomyces mucosus]|uniref:DUF202 domain-containing protein n=1 Tax=Wickerhamomyces mucosus TaxID=1378264 RepID=A0A9P8TCZ9_9ASCO|nr:hypothetical protein WICMUC_003451 [Wickerhamomyces mucosus]